MLLEPLSHGQEGAKRDSTRDHGADDGNDLGDPICECPLGHVDADLTRDLLEDRVDDPLGQRPLREFLGDVFRNHARDLSHRLVGHLSAEHDAEKKDKDVLLWPRRAPLRDRAAIAKGLVGRAAHCGGLRDRIMVDRCLWYLGRYTTRSRGVWVSARVAVDVNTPEPPVPDRRPARSMPDRVLKARVLADLKRSRTPLPNRRETPRLGACDGSLEICARAPPAVEGSSWCPTRLSTPGFYTPYRQAGSGSSQESCLCSRQDQRIGRVTR